MVKVFGNLSPTDQDKPDARSTQGTKMADTLAEELCDALANTFGFYFKAHAFHWNVTGPTFPQLHELFGTIYEDAHDAVDAIAERIRTLDELAPMDLDEMMKECDLKDSKGKMDAAAMVKMLLSDNELVVKSLAEAMMCAQRDGEVGIVNFLQDRIDRHAKWSWMLRAIGEK